MSNHLASQTLAIQTLHEVETKTSDLTQDGQNLSDSNQTSDLTQISTRSSLPEKAWDVPFLEYEQDGVRKTFFLNEPMITVGRDPKNALSLPLSKLSRIHCQITRRGGFWFLEDCESVNGTFLNHRKLHAGQKARLYPEAKIRLGVTSFEFRYRLKKLTRAEDSLAVVRSFGYFCLSSLWHSFLIITLLLLVWKAPIELPGSEAFRVQLIEPKLIEIPLQKLEEKNSSLPKEIAEEKAPQDPVPITEEVPVVEEEIELRPTPSLETNSKLFQSASPDLSTSPFSQRLFKASKRLKKKESGEKVEVSSPQESLTEVTLDPVETGDPLLSKVQQFKESIVVLNVTGSYDQSSFVLDRLKIKSLPVAPEILGNLLKATPQKPFVSFKKHQVPPYLQPEKHVLILNCGCLLMGSSNNYVEELIQFIAQGGYVITTDWSLDIWELAFPKWIQSGPKNLPLGDYEVYLSAEAKKHPLLHGAPENKKNFTWHVDVSSSYPKILSSRVFPLVVSKRGVPVAVTFSYQKSVNSENASFSYPGRVLHYVSHLNSQENPRTGEYNLQLILVNFLLLKQKEFEALQKAVSKK